MALVPSNWQGLAQIPNANENVTRMLLLIRNRRKTMPGKKHLRGVSDKEQREYEHIKESAEKSGRYGKRAAEVAARTVMKQHKEKGHAKGH